MAKSVKTLGAEFYALSTQLEEAVQQKMLELQQREEKWAELDKKVEEIASQAPSMVVLNVGGKKFATSKSTLLSVQDTFFTAMLCCGHWKPNDKGVYFIDRNPKHFGRILDFLRSGKLHVSDLSKEQMECLQEELDFYQLNEPAKQSVPVSFITTNGFEMTNNNNTVRRSGTGHCAIRLNKEMLVGKSYEWVIRLDSIVNSQWIGLGVGDMNTQNYTQIYGISSKNQILPTTNPQGVSGDWQTGDLIHVEYKNYKVQLSNQRTNRSHTVDVPPSNTTRYPAFDLACKGLTITVIHFNEL